MLTKKENERITRVGPGTPCGELMRRHWQPVAAASELTEEEPQMRVRILGEDLVLYRGEEGGYGLVRERCFHRGTSLFYGFIEGDCIRCAYHGWLYDPSGACVEQPFEPNPKFRERVHQPAYPVQKLGGLLFTYMGPPEKQPLLPRWDILVWDHGVRKIQMRQTLNCSWLQAEENSVDFVHTFFLHGETIKRQGRDKEVGFFTRPFARYGFQPCELGVLKSWEYEADETRPAGSGWGNVAILPNLLRQTDTLSAMHWRVPIDDEHTRIFYVRFFPAADGKPVDQSEDPPVDYEPSWINEKGRYRMRSFSEQDGMAWETQGAIFDRSEEHLGLSDRGVTMLRRMLLDDIERVERGEDPSCIVRDASKNTSLEVESLWASPRDPGQPGVAPQAAAWNRSASEVFDDRHEVYEVPFGSARPMPHEMAGAPARRGGGRVKKTQRVV